MSIAGGAQLDLSAADLRRVLSTTERNVLLLSRRATAREIARQMDWGDGDAAKGQVEAMLAKIQQKLAAFRTSCAEERLSQPPPPTPILPSRVEGSEKPPEPEDARSLRDRILDDMNTVGVPRRPADVARAIDAHPRTVASAMRQLTQAGKLVRYSFGVYGLPDLAARAPEAASDGELEESVRPVRLVSVPLPVDEAAGRLAAARAAGVSGRDVYTAILLDLVQRDGCEAHVFDRLERMLDG